MGYEFKKQQPSWSGFVQKYLNGDHSGKATVTFLPIINLNPSNESCIYSTLLFVEQQARKLNIANLALHLISHCSSKHLKFRKPKA